VVDDENDVVELVSTALRMEGYEVESASNGLEALNKARSLLPDVVVLDLMLPELDGTAVCEIMRRLPSTAHVPILILTACVTDAARHIALDAGANAYLTKPFSPRELVLHVNQLALQHPAVDPLDDIDDEDDEDWRE